MYDATSYVWALVLIVAIGIPLTTAIALYGGELTARMPRRADPALEGETRWGELSGIPAHRRGDRDPRPVHAPRHPPTTR